jgi:hypothetical protein
MHNILTGVLECEYSPVVVEALALLVPPNWKLSQSSERHIFIPALRRKNAVFSGCLFGASGITIRTEESIGGLGRDTGDVGRV